MYVVDTQDEERGVKRHLAQGGLQVDDTHWV